MPAHNAYQSLIAHLADCRDAKQIDALLIALLTVKERQDIANRIRIFDLLDQGVPHRDIAQSLGVGVATVSRGARAIKEHDVSALLASIRSGVNS